MAVSRNLRHRSDGCYFVHVFKQIVNFRACTEFHHLLLVPCLPTCGVNGPGQMASVS